MEILEREQWIVMPEQEGIAIFKKGTQFFLRILPWAKINNEKIIFSRWNINNQRLESRKGNLVATFEFQKAEGGLRFRLNISSSRPQNWEIIAPFETNLLFSPTTFCFYNGFQSWSRAEVLPIEMIKPNFLAHERILNCTELEPNYYSSSMLGAFLDHQQSQAIIIGILDVERFGRIHLGPMPEKDGNFRLTATAELDGVFGSRENSGWWYLNYDEPSSSLFEDYSRMFAALTLPKHSPAMQGWCSWYYHYQAVTENDILETVQAIKKGKWPLKVVQLDDGYQAAVGDWLQTNGKFPRGLAYLASEIQKAGLIPGIWLAPFMAEETSRLFREHPERFIKNPETGEPVFQEIWNKKQYSLDCTNPEVIGWLRDLSAALSNLGFKYLKLDFLYTACLNGKRYNSSLTGAQALRLGLRAIGESADVYLLGCGCPLSPAIGLVDAMRIGPDVHSSWDENNSSWGAYAAVRNAYCRWFFRKFWQNDPDVMIVRDFQNDLTEAQILTLACAFKDCGKFIFTSDPLERISKQRADISRKFVREAVGAKKLWRPDNPFEMPFPGVSKIKKIIDSKR